MEEDIKILEEFKKNGYSMLLMKYGDRNKANLKLERAIENILKRYKELEEENKELKEYIFVAPNLDEMTAVKYLNIQREAYIKGRAEEQQKAEQIIYENYIPTSVIQKKIEEVNNSNGYSPVNKIFIEKVLNEILEEGRK